MIFPMIRILELFLKLNNYWTISVVYYLFLFLSLFYFIKFKFDFKVKKKNLLWLILCIILGVLFGLFGGKVFIIEKSIWYLTIIPLIAFTEELFFRGMIQKLINKSYGFSYSVILTSLFYGVASLSFGLEFILFFILFSLVCSIVYDLTENLWFCMIINAMIHVFLFVI